MTVRESTSTAKRSWAIIGRKYSFNEDLFKASQMNDDTSSTGASHKGGKSATLGAAAGSKLLRSSSFSNMLSKDDSGTIGTLVGYTKYSSMFHHHPPGMMLVGGFYCFFSLCFLVVLSCLGRNHVVSLLTLLSGYSTWLYVTFV